MDDRYTDDRYFGPQDQYTVGSARPRSGDYSSAREYAAAGELRGARDDRGGRDYRGQEYRSQDYRSQDYRGGYGGQRDWDRSGQRDWDRGSRDWGSTNWDRGDRGGRDFRAEQARWSDSAGGWGRSDAQRRERDDRHAGNAYRGGNDRGFFERAGDEVRSWFGDEEAERRREADMRYDERMGRRERSAHPDDHYHNWRRSRIEELDRDYDEYRRENGQRFESEFNSWRTERQGQREGLGRVREHMEVVGSDGEHVGTVDKVRGDRILLTKSDADAGGHHHSIPSRWIDSVSDKVTLRKTAEEAQSAWRDEERSGALFGETGQAKAGDRNEAQDWRTEGNLNRSFPGTY